MSNCDKKQYGIKGLWADTPDGRLAAAYHAADTANLLGRTGRRVHLASLRVEGDGQSASYTMWACSEGDCGSTAKTQSGT